MTDGIELAPFAVTHPPRSSARPIASPTGDLPAALAELWRTYGPGPYGARLLRLVDPGLWQPVLDRWIVTPPNETRRVPIALTPFGTILYHRQLTATDEDVAVLDPVERSTAVLSWDLTAFFNETLADPEALEALVPFRRLHAALDTVGPLGPSEVYEVDQTLLPVGILKIIRTDALALHTRLRDAVDLAAMPDAPPAENLAVAMPPEHRATFADVAADAHGVGGLYLSVYFDDRRLLALEPSGDSTTGHYRLLFWRNHRKTGAPHEVRSYDGSYEIVEEGGDTRVRLAIALRDDSLGSDDNDADLMVMRGGGTRWLLRACNLKDIAQRIGRDGGMGRSEYHFRAARLDAPLPDASSDGVPAPPHTELPAALRSLLRGAST
ncbi:GAD-like domain-containing protein [Methylobacterium sp. WL6]|uniref:GAD-like domain-containing protein n=1 Tax=Methylobacterium sp. WL6 TaxID=2603901 RepID=UPI0011C789E3|nr:GAD-like domain-containing protein [Methylobacterium sp. WL6]TXN70477.1 hypothetical protein FV230_10505 [Methylobacterium sp. WL6]